MDARTQRIPNPARVQAAGDVVPAAALLMGLFLGGLTGAALWALQPAVCSELCLVHAFLAGVLVLAGGLYFLFGRQEGARAGLCFALSFGFGVLLFALAVSAVRILTQGEEGMLEPMALLRILGALVV